jgi:hypothetical protein
MQPAKWRRVALEGVRSQQRDILTIPNRKPVKAVYIRRLVRFVELVKSARHGKA